MSRAIIPASINPKYVPFLYFHFPGTEARYGRKNVKTVVLYNSSSLGKFLRINAVKADKPIEDTNITMYFSLTEKKLKGSIYKQVSGEFCFLMLPEEINKDLNKLIRDLFELTFLCYVDGFIANQEANNTVENAIRSFMTYYQLDEYQSFKQKNLHRLYYRKRSKPLLSNFQKSPLLRETPQKNCHK